MIDQHRLDRFKDQVEREPGVLTGETQYWIGVVEELDAEVVYLRDQLRAAGRVGLGVRPVDTPIGEKLEAT